MDENWANKKLHLDWAKSFAFIVNYEYVYVIFERGLGKLFPKS